MSKLHLRRLMSSDVQYFYRWWNDMALRPLTSGSKMTMSLEDIDASFVAMQNDPTEQHFMITVDNQTIGHISLSRRQDGWHETQIVIGEKDFWNKGYGTEAIQQLIQKARAQGIEKIYLEVRPENTRAITAYEKCGFKRAEIITHENAALPETLKMILE